MKDSITIGLAGDVMIGRWVDEVQKERPPAALWGNLLPILRKNDLNLINLETALTTSEERVPKVFNFKAHPSNVEALKSASIHVVNLANNHVLDFAEKGLVETLKTLNKAKIHYVGAGLNQIEASAPCIIDCKGIKVGILGCTDNEPSWKATGTDMGTFYLPVGEFDAIQEAIKKVRPQVDLLILSIHWGPNMIEKPPSLFQSFAHALIDLGVDVIHGHSAHIFQGVEIYQGKLIFYDTGDFVDDYQVDPFLEMTSPSFSSSR